jgi:hypothetical protein
MKKPDVQRDFGSDTMAKAVSFHHFCQKNSMTLFRHEIFGDSYLYEYLANLPEV